MSKKNEKISMQVEKPKMVSWQNYIKVPVGQNGKEMGTKEGGNGEYTVIFFFSKSPFVPMDSIDPTTSDAGDSYINIGGFVDGSGEKVKYFQFTTQGPSGEIKIKSESNTKGRLSSMRVVLNADNFNSALFASWNAVMPLISNLTYRIDLPCQIRLINSIEVKTGVERIFLLEDAISKDIPLTDALDLNAEEQRILLGLYREAINSTHTPLYSLFNFYKIFEYFSGINASRSRKELSRFKISSYSGEDFKGYSYRKFLDELAPKFRNGFAHTNHGEVVRNTDSPEDFFFALKYLNPCRAMARIILDCVLNERSW